MQTCSRWSSRVALLLVWICFVWADDGSSGASATATAAASTPAPSATHGTGSATPAAGSGGSGSGSGSHLLPEDMRTFLYKVLDNKPSCSEDEKSKLFQGYANNKQLFSECFDATGYVIFPNKGTPPTQQQIELFVGSTSCMKLFTGLVRANYRECEIYSFSPRSGAETMLRIRHDMVVEKRPAPSQQQYLDIYLYNRAVNTLTFNPKVRQEMYAKGAYKEFAYDKLVSMRSKMYLVPGVNMTNDMKIVGDASGSSSGIDSSDYGEKAGSLAGETASASSKSLTEANLTSSNSTSQKSSATHTSANGVLLVANVLLVNVALCVWNEWL